VKEVSVVLAVFRCVN